MPKHVSRSLVSFSHERNFSSLNFSRWFSFIEPIRKTSEEKNHRFMGENMSESDVIIRCQYNHVLPHWSHETPMGERWGSCVTHTRIQLSIVPYANHTAIQYMYGKFGTHAVKRHPTWSSINLVRTDSLQIWTSWSEQIDFNLVRTDRLQIWRDSLSRGGLSTNGHSNFNLVFQNVLLRDGLQTDRCVWTRYCRKFYLFRSEIFENIPYTRSKQVGGSSDLKTNDLKTKLEDYLSKDQVGTRRSAACVPGLEYILYWGSHVWLGLHYRLESTTAHHEQPWHFSGVKAFEPRTRQDLSRHDWYGLVFRFISNRIILPLEVRS